MDVVKIIEDRLTRDVFPDKEVHIETQIDTRTNIRWSAVFVNGVETEYGFYPDMFPQNEDLLESCAITLCRLIQFEQGTRYDSTEFSR